MAFTFTVEDGTGLAAANSYLSVADADDYHDGRGNTEWDKAANTDELKQDALVRATDYVEKRFGTRFRGKRSSKEQALAWPRMSAWDDDGYEFEDVPTKLEHAVAEYALRAISVHELSPDPLSPVQAQSHVEGATRTTTPTGEVKKFKETVGPLEEETEYMKGSDNLSAAAVSVKSGLVSDYNIPEYPAADMLLHGLLVNSSSRRVVRG
jgi:hypothetical protein